MCSEAKKTEEKESKDNLPYSFSHNLKLRCFTMCLIESEVNLYSYVGFGGSKGMCTDIVVI
jgi:hypothetical protein